MSEEVSAKIARFRNDKKILESWGENNSPLTPAERDFAVKYAGVLPENFELIVGLPMYGSYWNEDDYVVFEKKYKLLNQKTEDEDEEMYALRIRKDYQKSLREEIFNIGSQFEELVRDDKKQAASEVLVRYVKKSLKIYTTQSDEKPEMWVYKSGIYVPQGRSEIKNLLRQLIGIHFNQWYYNQVIAKIEPDTYIDPNEFFRFNNQEEIPVQNGLLNIFTGKVSPWSPDKIFFSKIPVKVDPSAQCPKIDEFLKQILSNEEDRKVIYELAGYALLKENKFEKAFMLVGDGRNGKSKLIELLRRLLGPENCYALPLSVLTSDNANVHQLFGKLLNLAGDISNRDLRDTGLFKSLTGRDEVTVPRKFLTSLTFTNFSKFIFACNELPTVYDMSRGFWERWVLLLFPYQFVTQEEYDKAVDKTNLKIKDENIIEAIATPEELSGFLNQALLALNRLLKQKSFSFTKGSKDIKEFWIRRSNSFMAFCLDTIEESIDGRIVKKDLRRGYAEYCKKHGIKMRSDKFIREVLQEYGATETYITVDGYPYPKQEHVWEGISWKKL